MKKFIVSLNGGAKNGAACQGSRCIRGFHRFVIAPFFWVLQQNDDDYRGCYEK